MKSFKEFTSLSEAKDTAPLDIEVTRFNTAIDALKSEVQDIIKQAKGDMDNLEGYVSQVADIRKKLNNIEVRE